MKVVGELITAQRPSLVPVFCPSRATSRSSAGQTLQSELPRRSWLSLTDGVYMRADSSLDSQRIR
jgi:hypothetical protein